MEHNSVQPHGRSPGALRTWGRPLIACAILGLSGLSQQTIAQGTAAVAAGASADISATVNQHPADVTYAHYKFKDGQTLPELRLHYVTLGQPHKNSAGAIDNAILLLHWTSASGQALLIPEYQHALFAPGAPLDAGRYFVIIPDNIGHGQSSKPSNGLRAAFPHYRYGDMVELQHKLVVESLGIAHLRAVIGMSMGCMNAWQWAEIYPDAVDAIMPVACFPAAITGRNLLWRKVLVEAIKSDPDYDNGNYPKPPATVGTALAIARMMIDGVPHLQEQISSPAVADGFLRVLKSQAQGADANDVIYSFESSQDFDADPALGQIKAKVFALNFADDEFYRDSLQILQRDIQQVHNARLVIRPTTAGSAGHLTMSHPDLWQDQVQDFMTWSGTR